MSVVSFTIHEVFLAYLPTALTFEDTHLVDCGILDGNPSLSRYVRPLTEWERSELPECADARLACLVQRLSVVDEHGQPFTRQFGTIELFGS